MPTEKKPTSPAPGPGKVPAPSPAPGKGKGPAPDGNDQPPQVRKAPKAEAPGEFAGVMA